MTRTQKLFSMALILAVGIAMIGMTLDAQAANKKDNRQQGEVHGRPPFPGMDDEKAGGLFDRAEGLLKKLVKDLNLTPEQQGEITKIIATFRQEQQAKMQERLATHREKIKELITGEFDEAKVREAYQQMEAEREAEREKMREDLFVDRIKLMNAINAVLTPEQVEIIQEKIDKFFDEDRPMFDRQMFNRPMFNRPASDRPGFDKEERPPVNN